VEGVRSQLPASARSLVVEVRQRTSWTIDVAPSVKARVDQADAWSADGEIHPGLEWYRGRHDLGLGYQAAARALGLPTVAGIDKQLCSAGGQARGVVAFWLAAQATLEGRDELLGRVRKVSEQGPAGAAALQAANALEDWNGAHGDQGGDWIPELGSGVRGGDLQAVAALLRLDRARVGDVVRTNWDAIRNPATTGTELFRLLGATPPAGYADLLPVKPGVGRACT
jgi:hypothetical protein